MSTGSPAKSTELGQHADVEGARTRRGSTKPVSLAAGSVKESGETPPVRAQIEAFRTLARSVPQSSIAATNKLRPGPPTVACGPDWPPHATPYLWPLANRH